MKQIRWNLGILVLNLGYKVRKYKSVEYPYQPPKHSLRWELGCLLLQMGHNLRGNIPKKTWKGVRI